MIACLLPNTSAQQVWRRAGMRALESQLQAVCPAPLMDLAGLATARLAQAVAPHARRIWIVAGPGNNGGDGLEAAIHLQQEGCHVQLSLLGDPARLPADARRAFERATQAGIHIQIGLPSAPPELGAQDLCIDALLGIGAARAPQGDLLQAIQWLNASAASVLAIDLPTGLDADSGQPLGSLESVVQADHTLTFLGAKPGLFMGHGRDACGTLWLAPLAEHTNAAAAPLPDAELNPSADPASRQHASHKGSHGDVAVVGGESLSTETGMGGAALLAAHPLATLLWSGPGSLEAEHLPLRWERGPDDGEHGTLRGHVARANPVWREAAGQAVLVLDDPLDGDSVKFADLMERDLVGLEAGSVLTRLLTAQAELQMRTMALRVQVRSFEAVCRAVQARLGIGILPLAAARSFAHAMQLKVLPLSDSWALRGMQLCMRSRPAQQTPLGQLALHLEAIAAGAADENEPG